MITPIYKPFKAHLEGEQPYLGHLLTMVINHFLNGMILQVSCPSVCWIQFSLMSFKEDNLIFNHFLNHIQEEHMSHEKTPGWLGYIGDCTTQLYGDYNKPL